MPVVCALAAYELIASGALPPQLASMAATTQQLQHTAAAHAAAWTDAAADAADAAVAQSGVSGAGWVGGLARSLNPARLVLMLPLPYDWLLAARRSDDDHDGGGGDGDDAYVAVDPTFPALAALALSFVVARAFASVYECVVDSIFVCAMQDKEEYGAAHMSDSLRDALDLDDAGGGGGGSKAAGKQPATGERGKGSGGGGAELL